MSIEEKKSWGGKLALIATIITIIGGLIAIFSTLKTFKKCPELEGTWTVTFKVQESTYNPYINDVYVYEIYVTQTENIISGNGEQKLYNGNYAKRHFKIKFKKADVADKINIAYIIQANRETCGMMNLTIDPDDEKHLIGTFNGGAASVKGLVDIKIE